MATMPRNPSKNLKRTKAKKSRPCRYSLASKPEVCFAKTVARSSGRLLKQSFMPTRRMWSIFLATNLHINNVPSSEHQNFEESTEEIAPLTEEEKAARLAELREKLAAKRAVQSEQDKEDKKRNDQIRRKATKEQQDIKEDLAKREQIKEAEAKRREKQADIEAKKRIQAKIAADKEERRLKAEREKAARAGQPAVAAEPAPAAKPTVPKTAANYTEARLRLQTSAGTIQKTFPIETTLFEVAQALGQEPGVQVSEFVQNFPKKVYDSSDFGQTLKEAGLVPSAALIVR